MGITSVVLISIVSGIVGGIIGTFITLVTLMIIDEKVNRRQL